MALETRLVFAENKLLLLCRQHTDQKKVPRTADDGEDRKDILRCQGQLFFCLNTPFPRAALLSYPSQTRKEAVAENDG